MTSLMDHHTFFFISQTLGKKIDLSEISVELFFKSYLGKHISDPQELDNVYKNLLAKNSELSFRPEGKEVFDYILDLVTHDKKYSRVIVPKVYEYISETLGISHDDFSEFCRQSKKVRSSFTTGTEDVTELERIFSLFYCMISVLDKKKKFQLSDQILFNDLVSHLEIEVENSEIWCEFRRFEDSFENYLRSNVIRKQERINFLAILASVMGGDLEFHCLEKQLLKKYFKAFDLTIEEVQTLKKKGDIRISHLVESIEVKSYPALVFGILEAMLVDGKIGTHEAEILEMILLRKSEFMVPPSFLMKFYYEILKSVGSGRDLGHIDLSHVNKLFSEFKIPLQLKEQLFYLTDTYLNVKQRMELSEADLQKCLLCLDFPEAVIPGLVDICKKDLNGTSHRVKNLAVIECLYCLKEPEGSDPNFLRDLLIRMVTGVAINKNRVMKTVLSFIVFKRNNLETDLALFEDICSRAKVYKDEIKDILFYLSLIQGKVVGKEIAFRE